MTIIVFCFIDSIYRFYITQVQVYNILVYNRNSNTKKPLQEINLKEVLPNYLWF